MNQITTVSNAALAPEAIAATLSAMEAMQGKKTRKTRERSVPGALSASRIMGQQERADTNAASAGFSAEAYGREMAKSFLDAMAKASGTWSDGVIYLLKTCNNKQQENAMLAASAVAKETKDDVAVASIGKRISEARRIFKAALADYKGTLDVMTGKGTWHAKITSLPKATSDGRGRKAGQGAGKSTKPAESAIAPVSQGANAPAPVVVEGGRKDTPVSEGKMAEAMAQAEATQANVPQRIVSGLSVEEVRKAIGTWNKEQKLQLLDVLLFSMSTQKDDVQLVSLAKACMKMKDGYDNAVLKAA